MHTVEFIEGTMIIFCNDSDYWEKIEEHILNLQEHFENTDRIQVYSRGRNQKQGEFALTAEYALHMEVLPLQRKIIDKRTGQPYRFE